MRNRVLSTLPSCPDWRKIRVGNSEKDEIPTEWELEQIVLDKLKLRRQQNIAFLRQQLIFLRQQVVGMTKHKCISESIYLCFIPAESMDDKLNDVTNVDFMTPDKRDGGGIYPSLMFQRTNQSTFIIV